MITEPLETNRRSRVFILEHCQTQLANILRVLLYKIRRLLKWTIWEIVSLHDKTVHCERQSIRCSRLHKQLRCSDAQSAPWMLILARTLERQRRRPPTQSGAGVSDSDFKIALEEFCTVSLCWARVYFELKNPREFSRAESLIDELLVIGNSKECDFHSRFRSLFKYIENRYWWEKFAENSRHNHHAFDGLLLVFATTFKGSLNWLREGESKAQGVSVISHAYQALRSSVLAFSDCHSLNHEVSKMQLRKQILRALLWQYKLDIKEAHLEVLKGCLIQTSFGSSIYLHDEQTFEQKERVAFHELGHLVLRHRSASEYYVLDPSLIESQETRESFAVQEREADGFAELRQHVLVGLVDYLLENQTVHSPGRERTLREAASYEFCPEPARAASNRWPPGV